MADSSDVKGAERTTNTGQREMWGSRWGFVMAAVGSAVGLGNMWRFPYTVSEGGGAAFVVLYIVFVLLMGIPLMLSELSIGRRTHLSPMGALRSAGSARWVPLGFIFVLVGVLILSFYSVISGWTIRYAAEALVQGFPEDPAGHFGAISEGWASAGLHLLFMLITVGIVTVGIQKGIERAVVTLMPVLALILVGLALWAATQDGAGAGYAFYLSPDMGDLLDPGIVVAAAGQAFFSLSLGMGAILTYASYLSKKENLNRESVTISFSDFGIAFLAGLVVFPIIASQGLTEQVDESAVGALFIALPAAFEAMGGVGQVVGALFFVALGLGALTSAISLLEVVTSSVIDEFKLPRKKAAYLMGAFITLLGFGSAYSTDFLGLLDAITGEFLLILGAFLTVVFVGWVMRNPEEELLTGASGRFTHMVPYVMVLVRYVLPVVLLLVLLFSVDEAWGAVRDFFAGG